MMFFLLLAVILLIIWAVVRDVRRQDPMWGSKVALDSCKRFHALR